MRQRGNKAAPVLRKHLAHPHQKPFDFRWPAKEDASQAKRKNAIWMVFRA